MEYARFQDFSSAVDRMKKVSNVNETLSLERLSKRMFICNEIWLKMTVWMRKVNPEINMLKKHLLRVTISCCSVSRKKRAILNF